MPTTRRSVEGICRESIRLKWIPLGPLGFNFSQHMPTTRPSVERTAEKACLLSDRVSLSSAEAREEGIQGGSLGVFEESQVGARSRTHRTQVSHYEAHGIPWLEYKSSSHGYPTR
jgi:hypothetical protein